MANILTPSEIVGASLASLENRAVLSNTIFRGAEADFSGQGGDTVTLRVPTLGTGARTYNTNRSQPIVMDELDESGVPVTLDTFLYKGYNVNDEDLTLSITDFNSQVILPAMQAVAGGADALVAAEINSLTATVSGADFDAVHDALLDAEGELNDNDVPLDGRFLVVGTNVRKALLKDKEDKLVRVASSGDNSALRAAIIGDLYGATVVYSNRVNSNTAVMYHNSAFAGAFKALDVARGATWGETRTYNGFALRVAADYDSNYRRDRVVADVLAGVATVKDGGDTKRAVKVTFA